jgi:hypothetical protein
MRHEKLIGISRVAVHPFVSGETSSKAHSQNEASMPNDAAGPEKGGPDRPHVRLGGAAQHFLKPIFRQCFDVGPQ